MDIVLATQNRDKIKEIQAILTPAGLSPRLLEEFGPVGEIDENGRTLADNALIKARTVRRLTGLCALADDTGLEVDVLDGAPGVYSSRYDGENATYESNCRKLLRELSGVPAGRRTARFRCVMALAVTGEAALKAERLAGILEPGILRPGAGAAASGESGGVDALITEGVVDGLITTAPRGTSGFGYDPVFELPSLGKTFAEMGSQVKNRASHRYRALIEMRELIMRLQEL
jgi:XTP/dITP diphosphohydrolase